MKTVHNKSKSILCMMILLVCCASKAYSQAPNEVYERDVFITSAGDSLNYRLLVPENMQDGVEYPLVLFMHGAGERGTENERQLIHGAQVWLNPVYRMDYPAYVLIPQCPPEGYWAFNERPESFVPEEMPILEEPTQIILDVMELLDSVCSRGAVDRDRIYVSGLSMGGMATYDLAIRFPEVFAAAVPICGTVNPARLEAAKDVKFRIYHGASDTTVPVDGSRHAYRALRALGADVIYVEFPGVGHGSWYPAFTDDDFMPWLFAQKKKQAL